MYQVSKNVRVSRSLRSVYRVERHADGSETLWRVKGTLATSAIADVRAALAAQNAQKREQEVQKRNPSTYVDPKTLIQISGALATGEGL